MRKVWSKGRQLAAPFKEDIWVTKVRSDFVCRSMCDVGWCGSQPKIRWGQLVSCKCQWGKKASYLKASFCDKPANAPATKNDKELVILSYLAKRKDEFSLPLSCGQSFKLWRWVRDNLAWHLHQNDENANEALAGALTKKSKIVGILFGILSGCRKVFFFSWFLC